MLNIESGFNISVCQKVTSWITGFAEISVPLALHLLILAFSCFRVSSTTLSLRCLWSLRPRVIFREFVLIMDLVVRTLRDKSSCLLRQCYFLDTTVTLNCSCCACIFWHFEGQRQNILPYYEPLQNGHFCHFSNRFFFSFSGVYQSPFFAKNNCNVVL